mgnify:FL=1
MKKLLLLWLLTLAATVAVHAQRVEVYRQLPSDQITASASSTLRGSSAAAAVDGAGMRGDLHEANNLGHGMWVSQASVGTVRYSPSTREGVVWFLCQVGDKNSPPRQVDQIRVWNHNQNEHTRRGLNKVYIEYSADGQTWQLLPDGRLDYHVIPESVGRNPEPADLILNTPGLKARYICFTAAAGGEGNHYDRNDPVVMREAADMHQNPDYYGLAEIRFYTKERADVRTLAPVSELSLAASQGYLKTPEGPSREFTLRFDNPIYAGADLAFECGGRTWSAEIAPSGVGVVRYDGLFPAGYMEETAKLVVRLTSRQGTVEKRFEVPAARKWTVNFLSHSHQDIGYTHRQMDVMKLQWRNLERAMDLAERTKDYPEGARYRWNTEATWSIAGYLEAYAGTDKAARLIQAVRDGVINIDAPLGSILTGICRQEELMHMFDDAHRLAREIGVEVNTAMMSDVPGQVWGLTTAMSKNGVKYYSPGPNYVPFYGKIGNDRAAALHVEWGDRPFYWQSQSGTDKVLVWQAGRGYSWFHGWLAGRLSVCGVEPIWNYLQELETDEFPYNTCYLRYTVHGDNGPPDELMPDVIRAWNERYDSPQFRITTTKEFFTAFEEQYGEYLPTYGGDMTPTWEDGASSTARETAMNRESAARLARTEILWSMLSPESDYPARELAEAWKNVLLFSEHTWGASASGPDPYSQFTKDLWAGKKMYADSADVQSRRLCDEAMAGITAGEGYVQVLNTNLWPRTDVVTVAADLTGKRLLAPSGEPVAVQRLHDGGWIFLAEEVPALSSSVYRIVPAKTSAKAKKSLEAPVSMIDGNTLDNGLVRVAVDPAKGTIRSLKAVGSDYEYAAGEGLNDYIYSGRIAADPRGIDRVTGVETLDDGPVAATLRIVSDAPGCNALWRDVTVYRGLGRVDIRNTVDKQDILEHESVRFVFPFNFAHPEITMDLAMSEMHPEREQLAGVNKHYYSLLNGMAVGDLEHAVCLTTLDAPFVELGTPSGEDYRLNPRHGYGWWPSAQISPVVYSWVMNNTWRTNYKASQGGVASFRYSLQISDPFDLKLKQRGAEREQPLIAVESGRPEPVGRLFRLEGRNRIAVSGIAPSADGTGYIVRLQNMGDQSVHSAFVWGRMKARRVSVCDYREQPLAPFDDRSFWMKPFEYLMLKVETE